MSFNMNHWELYWAGILLLLSTREHFHSLCIDRFWFSNRWNPKSQILVKQSWVMEPSKWVTGFALALSRKTQSESKISPPPSHIYTVCKKYHRSVDWQSWINAMSMNRTNKTCRWWRLADVVHTAGGVRRKKFNIWPGSRITPQLMVRIYFAAHFSLLPFCSLLVMPK